MTERDITNRYEVVRDAFVHAGYDFSNVTDDASKELIESVSGHYQELAARIFEDDPKRLKTHLTHAAVLAAYLDPDSDKVTDFIKERKLSMGVPLKKRVNDAVGSYIELREPNGTIKGQQFTDGSKVEELQYKPIDLLKCIRELGSLPGMKPYAIQLALLFELVPVPPGKESAVRIQVLHGRARLRADANRNFKSLPNDDLSIRKGHNFISDMVGIDVETSRSFREVFATLTSSSMDKEDVERLRKHVETNISRVLNAMYVKES